jgi:hypothetical protein
MPAINLNTMDPELMLQELRARGDREAEARDLEMPSDCGCAPVSFATPGGVGILHQIPGLENCETQEIIDALRGQQKVIYGTDDRQDMYQIIDAKIIADADSVVTLLHAGDIVDNGNGTSTINGQNFGTRYSLCITEPFRDQMTAAFCSGFLVDPSLIATAAHCVDTNTLSDIRFVFGFEMTSATTFNTTINNS